MVCNVHFGGTSYVRSASETHEPYLDKEYLAMYVVDLVYPLE